MTRSAPQPTSTELVILRVLWDRGPSTVREIYEVLNKVKPTGYTTVLKMLQIMTAKGTVLRNENQRAHVYEACQPAEKTRQQLAGDLLKRVFGGSASQLLMHALAGKKASQEEIEEIRQILKAHEESAQ
jgi:predicted transcriptional regulator